MVVLQKTLRGSFIQFTSTFTQSYHFIFFQQYCCHLLIKPTSTLPFKKKITVKLLTIKVINKGFLFFSAAEVNDKVNLYFEILSSYPADCETTAPSIITEWNHAYPLPKDIHTPRCFPSHLTVSHPFKVIFLSQSLPSLSFQSVLFLSCISWLLACLLPEINQSSAPILFLTLYLSHSPSLRPFHAGLYIINQQPPPPNTHTPTPPLSPQSPVTDQSVSL